MNYMYTSCKQIRRNKISAQASSEIMEHSVAMRLRHFCVDVITTVTEFRDFLCKQFYSLGRIAEDNALGDV